MRIAVDAMGGDNAPAAIVAGALAARQAGVDLEIVLVGREGDIRAAAAVPEGIEIVHAPEVIENDDKPLLSLRRKRHSSMVIALSMLKEIKVDAVVSAGNTGAFMAGASLLGGASPGSANPPWRLSCPPWMAGELSPSTLEPPWTRARKIFISMQ